MRVVGDALDPAEQEEDVEKRRDGDVGFGEVGVGSKGKQARIMFFRSAFYRTRDSTRPARWHA